MKRQIIACVLGVAVVLAGAQPCAAAALGLAKIGVGAYGVSNIPLAQDDAESGGLFGIRGRVGLLGMLAFEPSVTFLKNSDADNVEGSGVNLKATDVTATSFNLIWGGAFYGTAGIGVSSVDVPGPRGSSNETTYNFGSGIEMGVGPIAVDVGARLFVINTESGASRKNLGILAGVNYYFL